MALRCGIDLGTTYSAISWYDSYNNRVETLDLNSADGAKMIRSVVYYPGPGQPPVVGETAWNAARQSPERVIVGIKRSMGTGYKTPPIDGVEYTPPQVSAEILKVLARDAEGFLGEAVKDVIITVPAYFGDNERAATLEAGQLAGLNVLQLLPEPHAAALAFAVDRVADIMDRHLLVYDLGGGTFDVTVIHATAEGMVGTGIDLKIETLCKDGNAALGGLDWDRVLADLVADKVQQVHGVDIRQDPRNEAILLDNCEKAKRHLSRTNTVSIVADLAHHLVDVALAEYEDRTRSLLLQTQLLVEKVLDEARTRHGLDKDRIEVLLTGGSSRMPMVRTMIEAVMGKPPLQHGNPELLVTLGAAYRVHLLDGKVNKVLADAQGNKTRTDVGITDEDLTDLGVYAIGVEVLRPDGQGGVAGFNTVVVPREAKYGEVFEREFRTAQDGMTEIPIILYKGESADLAECDPLMTFTISGLPAGRPRGQPVRVRLGYDHNGIIRGTAVDVRTNKEVDIFVDRSKKEPAVP